MIDVWKVQARTELGTNRTRQLRKRGLVPAELYGHGEPNVHLAVPVELVEATLRHGGKVVRLEGAVQQQSLIRDVQWDPFGVHVLHLDLERVSAHERVTVTVPVELRGEAPGVREGGQLHQPVHELEIECPVDVIPEKLEVTINELHLNGQILASQVPLPQGAKLLGDPDAVIVQCMEAVAVEVEEVEAVAPEAGEPEVIGRKAEEPEEGEGES